MFFHAFIKAISCMLLQPFIHQYVSGRFPLSRNIFPLVSRKDPERWNRYFIHCFTFELWDVFRPAHLPMSQFDDSITDVVVCIVFLLNIVISLGSLSEPRTLGYLSPHQNHNILYKLVCYVMIFYWVYLPLWLCSRLVPTGGHGYRVGNTFSFILPITIVI